jgi:GT2 family glycosyltransferase
MTELSIILNTWNHVEITRRCLERQIAGCGVADREVIVNDNGSTDGCYEYIRDVIRPAYLYRQVQNIGNPQGINLCLGQATGRYIAKIDPDFRMPADWAARAIAILREHDKVALVGFHWARDLEAQQGRLQRGPRGEGPFFVPPGRIFGCWVFRAGIIDELGCFRDDASSYGLWDAEFCNRLRLNGYQTVYADTADDYCVHLGADDPASRRFKDRELHRATRRKTAMFADRYWRGSRFFRGWSHEAERPDMTKFDGNWSYDQAVWTLLHRILPFGSSILEFGGGQCTPELHKWYRVFTVEDDYAYPGDLHVPFNEDTRFYDLTGHRLPQTQAVLIDGPSALKGADRAMLAEYAADHLSPLSMYVVDDTHRQAEQRLATWLGEWTRRRVHHVSTPRKAFAYILPG